MRFHSAAWLSCVVLLASLAGADSAVAAKPPAADILSQVPPDSLAFAVVRNLSTVDSKVGQLSSTLRRNLPRPLQFLHDFTGIQQGLDPAGDLLLVLLPERGDGKLQFAVWIPVTNFDQLLASLNATSVEGIAAVSIAGEDLLIARHDRWAVVMDPDQRQRLAELAATQPTSAALPSWKSWIAENDLTFVAFHPVVQQMLHEFSGKDEIDNGQEHSGAADDVFGAYRRPGRVAAGALVQRTSPVTTTWEFLHSELRKWFAVAPELQQLFDNLPAAACGIRFDDDGNALVGFRAALERDVASELTLSLAGAKSELPFAASPSHDSDPFVLNAAGILPPHMLSSFAIAYVRRTAADLASDEHTTLDPASLEQLCETLEQAAAEVESFSLLDQPGTEAHPVYTNSFAVLRVAVAGRFIEQIQEVMRLWNKANREAEGETRLIFDVEETKLGNRSAIQCSLDVAALEGDTAALPEVRQAMEKLFGRGGKLRLWLIPADEHHVLLAAATPEQVTLALQTLDRKLPLRWNSPQLASCNLLLPQSSDWRCYFDLARLYDWKRREAQAMTAVPVIGGSLVRPFPPGPPLALAGGVRESTLSIDLAIPSLALRGIYDYFLSTRASRTLQFRARIAPPPAPNGR